ncbi:MAG TPA: prepilin peptidase [Oculatellaceae cyanobacterium]
MDSIHDFFLWLATPGVERDVLAALVGLCVGSFLNVVALRTLQERPMMETLFGRSECPKCKCTLGIGDLIPLLSFILLNGKCRNCKQPISWQYPAVELVTAIAFVAVLHHFELTPAHVRDNVNILQAVSLDVGIIFFFCVLIAVCVTDFKEKLIPHEITYPAIIVGIIFSAFVREDLMPSLAGVGISYVLFDFLAFYGLKLYYHSHGDEESEEEINRVARANDRDTLANCPDGKERHQSVHKWTQARDLIAGTRNNGGSAHAIEQAEAAVSSTTQEAATTATTKTDPASEEEDEEDEDYDPQIDAAFSIDRHAQEEEEDFEVMGGGDAVLAGLIAAWIGLENLGVTLLFGFLIGSLMGSAYVAVELYRRKNLAGALKKTGLITLGLILLAESTVVVYAHFVGYLNAAHTKELLELPWATLAGASTFGGILIGTILAGRDASKPFPFGPALAIGAVIAVFIDPAQKLHVGETIRHLSEVLFPTMTR